MSIKNGSAKKNILLLVSFLLVVLLIVLLFLSRNKNLLDRVPSQNTKEPKPTPTAISQAKQVTTLSGRVETVNATEKSFTLQNVGGEGEKKYKVKIDNDTQISALNMKSETRQASFENIKIGDYISVETSMDPKSSLELKATGIKLYPVPFTEGM